MPTPSTPSAGKLTESPRWSLPTVLSESRGLRYFTFFYLYALQGIPAGFSLTALSNYLTAESVKPQVIGAFVATVGLPWAFQFLWGPFIDRYQSSPMGRRRPWVLGSQLMAFLASLGLLLVQDPVTQTGLLATTFLVHSVFASVQDAGVDAMAISVIPESERGRINAFMRAGFLGGTGFGAVVFAYLLRSEGFRVAALAQSGLLLALTVLTFFLRERPEDRLLPFGRKRPEPADRPPGRSYRWLFRELFRGLFSRRSLVLFGSILLVYISHSLFIRVFNFHLIRRLGWADTEVSVLTGTYGMLLAMGVSLLGGYLADWLGPRRLLIWVMLLTAVYLIGINALASYWAERSFTRNALITWYIMDPCLSIAAMPVLMAICRKGVEGSQFTTYMALVNFSDVTGSFVAGMALSRFSAPSIGLLAGGLVLGAIAVVGLASRYRIA
ncbi:MFS transporter [Larkinella soli]|uniref:MFS transporter n=1 Tax=Larkinella soli TaxID=1770527 RepID=UPI000FFC6FBC|nr:MFS transporter [Larkinella soli]